MMDNNITMESELQDEAEKEISAYWESISRKRAVEGLLCNINTIQQGFCPKWETGIEDLDTLLDGGLRAKQLICLGAIPSLGKSSLVLQIADNIARSGRDVLYISLEMDSDELLAKSISRETYLLSLKNKTLEKYRLNTSDILSGRVGALGEKKRQYFDEALERVQETDEHLFYLIGENNINVDYIRTALDIHQKKRNRSPVVFVDYLQILKPSEDAKQSRNNDKRLLTDEDVTALKTIARDYKVPVVIISAFNRDAYLRPVSTSSFRESSGIEYSADVLIGMQYTGSEYHKNVRWITEKSGKKTKLSTYESKADHENRVREKMDEMDEAPIRPITLKVMKNRNGIKGRVYLDFVAGYNYFKPSLERENDVVILEEYEESEAESGEKGDITPNVDINFLNEP